MLQQRQSLIEERRKASIATKLQKESIAKMMEEVRTNASKANKIINKAMSGKISLTELLQKSSPSPARSRSSEKTSVQRKEPTFESGVVGLGRQTKSAGDQPEFGATNSSEFLYSKPLHESTPQAFVSPYAIPLTEV